MQSSLRQRFASLALVVLLHLLLLLAVLQMVVQPHAPARMREIFFRLSVPQKERPALALPLQTRSSRGAPVLGARPSTAPAPAIAAPDIRGLGQSVFGCAPENLPNLSPEQRSHCHGLMRPDQSLLVEPPSHVKDPQRRAAEMRTKNTPGHIPCAIVMDTQAPGGGAAPGVDPLCIVGGLLNGFGPANGLPK